MNNSYVGKVYWKVSKTQGTLHVFRRIFFSFLFFDRHLIIFELFRVNTYAKSATHPLSLCAA